MKNFAQNAPRFEEPGLQGSKEERTLRNAFAHFAWTTAAMLGSAAGLATCIPSTVVGDDVRPATRPAGSQATDEEGKTTQSKKVALAMMAEAQRYAAAGQMEKAAAEARRALALKVSWLPGEPNPQKFLNDLAAHAPGRVVVSDVSTAKTGDTTQKTLKKQRYFAALVDSAKDDLQLGRLELAQARAAAARKIAVAQHFLDDRANRILAEVDRLRRSRGIATASASEPTVIRAQSPADAGSADAKPAATKDKGDASPFDDVATPQLGPKQQAKQLLAEARSAFEKGDFDEARVKALKADEFDVKWDVLEDQPKALLSEIERSTGTKIFARKKKPVATTSSDP